jgi:uncharacterized phage protein (TIGR02216 family)
MFTANAARLAGLAGATFGWRPAEFWAATPAELASIIDALDARAPHTSPPNRAAIQALMEMFPDESGH